MRAMCARRCFLPDTIETRNDMAAFMTSARHLDQGVGQVLQALEPSGRAQNTLVICTTDHGIAFPGAKCNLTDAGIGVMLIMRGPQGFSGGRVCNTMVSQVDIFPTLCDLAASHLLPGWKGGPCMPWVNWPSGGNQRRALRRGDLPRGVRASTRRAHQSLEVHPALRRPADPCASRTAMTAPARTSGWSRVARALVGAGAALRPAVRPKRGK